MLLECLNNFGEYRVVRALRRFLHSPLFTALSVFLMVCANVFSLELPVFYLYLIFGLLVVLFDDDLAPLIAVILCCYMTISYANNPAAFPPKDDPAWRPSAFYDPLFVIQLTFIIAAAVVILLTRFIVILMRGENKKVPALALGFCGLGLAYVLAGLFSRYYDFKTALFGFVQILSLSGLYFLFYYGVDWKKTDKGMFARVFTMLGIGMLAEVVGMYCLSGEISALFSDGEVNRANLVTGWGIYNNVGCALAMCAPAPLYYAVKKRQSYLYLLLAFVLYIGVVFTQSRGCMLLGGLAFLFGIAATLAMSRGCNLKVNAATVGVIAGGAAVLLIVFLCDPAFKKAVEEAFAGIFEVGLDDSGRWEIYQGGIEQFKKAPFFGVGFYRCGAFRWGDLPEGAFLPPRYHNTYVQLLASGGIFALACYALHRLETVLLLFRRITAEKIFIAVCISAFLLTSFVDCHFFNFGPGMLYGTLLAFAEGSEKAEPNEKTKSVS